MFRSIIFNCLVGLIAFTIYFVVTIYQSSGLAAPFPTIAFSLLWGLVGFIAAYGIRAFIQYILYTPEIPDLETDIDNDVLHSETDAPSDTQQTINKTSTVEFQDESSEDIAQVVRTMLQRDEPYVEK